MDLVHTGSQLYLFRQRDVAQVFDGAPVVVCHPVSKGPHLWIVAFFGSQLSIGHIGLAGRARFEQEVFVFSDDGMNIFFLTRKRHHTSESDCPKTRFHIRGFSMSKTIWMPAPKATFFDQQGTA